MSKGIMKNPLFEKTTKHQDSNTLLPQNAKEKAETVKLTCYLPPDAVKSMEKMWYDARTTHGEKVTRSFIIERAIEFLAKDFSDNQKNSYLLK